MFGGDEHVAQKGDVAIELRLGAGRWLHPLSLIDEDGKARGKSQVDDAAVELAPIVVPLGEGALEGGDRGVGVCGDRRQLLGEGYHLRRRRRSAGRSGQTHDCSQCHPARHAARLRRGDAPVRQRSRKRKSEESGTI